MGEFFLVGECAYFQLEQWDSPHLFGRKTLEGIKLWWWSLPRGGMRQFAASGGLLPILPSLGKSLNVARMYNMSHTLNTQIDFKNLPKPQLSLNLLFYKIHEVFSGGKIF